MLTVTFASPAALSSATLYYFQVGVILITAFLSFFSYCSIITNLLAVWGGPVFLLARLRGYGCRHSRLWYLYRLPLYHAD